MKLVLRILLPVLILSAAAWGAWTFIKNKPKPRSMTPPPQVTLVEGKTVQLTDYQIYLDTRGTVTPRTSTTLFPQVSGQIMSISPQFREGGFFEKGEILVSIEKVDYETEVVVASSRLAEARRNLEEEKARGRQAVENWRRLGRSGQPSDMVQRIPQRDEAEARVRAAEADLEQARRDLERTEIRAPYNGRVEEQMVDIGQFVSPGNQLARTFATDYMEVRLPLTNRQLGFVDLPETFRNDDFQVKGPDVEITARIGRSESIWHGEVVRVDSAIDEESRQLFVVAQVKDPYKRRASGGPPLKIGMFVDAKVTGQTLRDVIVLPRSTVRVSGEVIVIDEENKIQRRTVDPIWKGETEVVLPSEGGGISPGEVICLTPIAFPVNGTPVLPAIDGVPPKIERLPPIGKGKGKGSGKGMKGKSKENS